MILDYHCFFSNTHSLSLSQIVLPSFNRSLWLCFSFVPEALLSRSTLVLVPRYGCAARAERLCRKKREFTMSSLATVHVQTSTVPHALSRLRCTVLRRGSLYCSTVQVLHGSLRYTSCTVQEVLQAVLVQVQYNRPRSEIRERE